MLRNRTVLLTGAARGIGAAASSLFAREGARLVLNDLSAAEAETAARAVRDAGGEAIAVGGSVIDPGVPEALVAAALDRYGVPDIIVNNAGFLWDGTVLRSSQHRVAVGHAWFDGCRQACFTKCLTSSGRRYSTATWAPRFGYYAPQHRTCAKQHVQRSSVMALLRIALLSTSHRRLGCMAPWGRPTTQLRRPASLG